jgi:hypothetical protein
MPPFRYTSLSSQTTDFRLMNLELRGDLDDIRCHVSTHSLEVAPVYSALSCKWGDPEDAVDILMDGKMFSVRHNP